MPLEIDCSLDIEIYNSRVFVKLGSKRFQKKVYASQFSIMWRSQLNKIGYQENIRSNQIFLEQNKT